MQINGLEMDDEETRAAVLICQSPHMLEVPAAVDYEPFGSLCNPSNADGVYFLFLDDKLQYIGKATNFSNRFRAHWKLRRFDFNRVAFIAADIALASALESYWIAELSPPMNRKFDGAMELQATMVRAALGRTDPVTVHFDHVTVIDPPRLPAGCV